MGRIVTIDTVSVFTADETISDCQPDASAEKMDINVERKLGLHKVEDEAFDRKGRRIIAVVGTFSCALCKHECSEALVALHDDGQVNKLASVTLESDASVSIVALNKTLKVKSRQDSAKLPGTEPGTPTDYDFSALPHAGWGAKETSQLADLAIDLHGSVFVSVDPMGNTAFHQGGFQTELEFLPDQKVDLSPEADGQLRLF